MSAQLSTLRMLMEEAVAHCVDHVTAGGLPFAGVVVTASGEVSSFGVNAVADTGDPTAHAEIVAMREIEDRHGAGALVGADLLATGEPCGLCYQYAIDHGIARIHVALDRDGVAARGFDYRASYRMFGISDERRAGLMHRLPVIRSREPFKAYLELHAAN